MGKLLLFFALLIFACAGDDDPINTSSVCVDETLIDLESFCVEIFEPVCGCNGVTYDNSCMAMNWNGVISYEEGACD